ncbi:hypothetical protein BHE74_00058360 [Ensete ventricosum]|nr:hypothetical protein GW17_00002902 [Ensete ventricosum]RWW36607.1 hypothetical protein BHE74_00058360 [Ensete ventricosum]
MSFRRNQIGSDGYCNVYSPTFVKIIKKGTVEQFSPIPYLATALNCMLWIFYGLPFVHPNSLLVITINGIGLAFESVYLTIFLIYSNAQGRVLAAEIAFVAVVVVVVLLVAHTYEKRTLIVGILCIIFGTCMYAAPLSVMIPNGLGTLLALSQLILYACYYKATPRPEPKSDIELHQDI